MKFLKSIGLPVLSVVLTCLFPCVFLYASNAGEAVPMDALPFFGFFLLTAAVILLVLLVILRGLGRTAFLTDLTMLVVINFTVVSEGIKKIIPGFRDVMLLAIAAVVLLGLMWLLLKKKPGMTTGCGLLSLAFGVMILVNLAAALPTIISTAAYRCPEPPLSEELEELTFDREKRNVYVLLFDEYGGPENTKRYYDFDNSAFFGGLSHRGFAVAEHCKNTESPWTATLMPNILNLDYVADDDMEVRMRNAFVEDPMLYRIFRENGYSINLINHTDYLGTGGCHVLTAGQKADTIADYLYDNSIFSQIPRVNTLVKRYVLHRGEDHEAEALCNAFEALEGCVDRVGDGPTLTVSYINFPHWPSVFSGDGQVIPPPKRYDWEDPNLYLGQLQYGNDVILRSVDRIRERDPEAVILLMSDHGSRRPAQLLNFCGGPDFDHEAEVPYMENALCCLYIPGMTPEIEGQTGINVTRIMLNETFGLELPLLEIPPDYVYSQESVDRNLGRG